SSCDTAKRPENKSKNRFDHILAYDHSRVILQDKENVSDYTNANYISSRHGAKSYIASQGPFNPQTICDFWSVVYTEEVSCIIFLSQLAENDVVKCERYWPEDDLMRKYGEVIVKKIRMEKYANFIIRTFILINDSESLNQESQRVTQFHFTSWKSNEYSILKLLEFWQKVKNDKNGQRLPWLVHCSTGISRSAVFLAMENCLGGKRSHGVNVYQCCNRMRKCRPWMVKTLKHYQLIYDLLYEA
ncbi:hypothetical protein HELRODRAFT_134015, partial [Helobdella robusta]|uniref:protein-tyrosine-phosphatase n=1 Tax=Helobdella robusta TaxID=6412 RepID=T1EI31_HELRO